MKYSLIALFLSLSFTLSAQDVVQPVAVQPANPAIVPTHRLGIEWWRVRLAAKEAQAKQQHDTVLIGDSITHFWDEVAADLQQAYFGPVLNLGFSGDKAQDVLWRIQRINWETVAPKRIMLMIGTNNTGHDITFPYEKTFEGVRAIVTYLRQQCPQAKITLLAIFPRGVNGADQKRCINDKINLLLPTLAEGDHVIYRDISKIYFAEDGHTLRADLMPDYLHPNREGYRLWGEAVAAEFMGTPQGK